MTARTKRRDPNAIPEFDRILVEVKFITWVPADVRLAAAGKIPTGQKEEVGIRLWAPLPLDAVGNAAPDKVPPSQQGVMWAMHEVVRMRPDGREVLAITGVTNLGLVESSIANQPMQTATQQDVDAALDDMGLTDGEPGDEPGNGAAAVTPGGSLIELVSR